MPYADLKYLSVPLPEDILHAREHGDFDLALSLIDRRIAGGTLPEALKKRLLLEREIVLQLPHEYTIPEEEAFEELKDGLGEFTREEFDRLILDHDLDWAYVNGRRHIHEDSIANLYKVRDDLSRRAYERGKRDDPGGPSPLLDAAIAEMKEKGVKSIAISGVFSTIRNDNEQRVAEIAKEVMGEDVHVSISSEIGSMGLQLSP